MDFNPKDNIPSEKQYQIVNWCEFDKYAAISYAAVHNESPDKNLGDITKVDETKLENFNMICGGSPCFTAGTKVMTPVGYKNIENIEVGDLVLTHKNRYKKVLNVGNEKEKEVYELRVQGFLPTKCTGYHPFYVRKNANEEPKKMRLHELKKGYYIGSHINLESKNEYNLSNELCWILGRYVADGHIRRTKRKDRKNSYIYQCVLSIGNQKVEELKKNVKTHHFSCYPHTKSTHRVVFSSMNMVNFIDMMGFGKSAETKNIPNFILDLPIDKLLSFFEGYMSGDGSEVEGKFSASTVSKELAMKLCLIVQKIYRVGCRIYFDEKPKTCVIEGRTVNQKDSYMIRFMRKSQKQAWFIKDDIVWYPIKEITKLNRIEDVYNIEVEEDHTYTANNMITFNCQDFSLSGKQAGSKWKCLDCGEEYNPLIVHFSKRKVCPKCGSNNLDKTRSSLLVEWLRIIQANKPNWGIYENVKNITGKQFRDTFDMFVKELNEYGYNVYWKILNSKDYGIPQNRERVYVILIKKELDSGKFVFPEGFDSGIKLKDILEESVDEKYYINSEKTEKLILDLIAKGKLPEKKSYSKKTVLLSNKGETFEKYVDIANTLLARDYKGFGNQSMNGVVEHENIDDSVYRIRKLTPNENWRLMGFTDEEFEKARNAGVSNTQLYKQAGNSIVVNVLYQIYVKLYEAMPYLFENLKVSSYFSGIGAFESALDRLYKDLGDENFTCPQEI